MAKIVWTVLLALGAAFGFSRGEKVPEITKIEFSASACFGVCPAYNLTLTSDGEAVLVWKPPHRDIIARRDTFFSRIIPPDFPDSVLKSSKDLIFRGTVPPEKYRELCKMFDSDEFFTTGDYRERVTDLPGYRITLTTADGEVHTVFIYGLNPPEKMTRWKRTLEKIVHSIDWEYASTNQD